LRQKSRGSVSPYVGDSYWHVQSATSALDPCVETGSLVSNPVKITRTKPEWVTWL
jgi:hypothetical protein